MTDGICKRCLTPKIQRLYSLQFRKKQYWICKDCIKEIDKFIRGGFKYGSA